MTLPVRVPFSPTSRGPYNPLELLSDDDLALYTRTAHETSREDFRSSKFAKSHPGQSGRHDSEIDARPANTPRPPAAIRKPR